jgi:hypothetical protein
VQPAVVAEGESAAAVDDVAADPGLRLGFREVVCLNVEVIDNGRTRAPAVNYAIPAHRTASLRHRHGPAVAATVLVRRSLGAGSGMFTCQSPERCNGRRRLSRALLSIDRTGITSRRHTFPTDVSPILGIRPLRISQAASARRPRRQAASARGPGRALRRSSSRRCPESGITTPPSQVPS